MLHLIWSKDNSSTSEDGKELKGIRSRLLECYRSIYFDPIPDMEPKQQVNRIAKNMIEYVVYLLRYSNSILIAHRLTYDATLAELTSLEEMMRIMVEEDQIHRDVISKLWQVYSTYMTGVITAHFCSCLSQALSDLSQRCNDEALSSSWVCWQWPSAQSSQNVLIF